MSVIDDHLTRFDGAQREALRATSEQIRKLLPGAEEAISYRMPTFKIGGIAVIGIEGFSGHNSLFPFGGQIVEELAGELAGYTVTKGSIHFTRDKPFPPALLLRIVRRKIELINAEFPTKAGEFREFYDNGMLKTEGKQRGDDRHGEWRWYRRDGSLMRTGRFDRGERVGVWTTYDQSGNAMKEADFG